MQNYDDLIRKLTEQNAQLIDDRGKVNRPKKASERIHRALNPVLTEQIRQVIEENPTYGVRRITAVVRRNLERAVNKKAVHRIIKINGWQKRTKSSGFKKRASQMKSQTTSSNVRWAIDATSIFCGEDGWCPLTAIIDCCDRCIVGWRLSLHRGSQNMQQQPWKKRL